MMGVDVDGGGREPAMVVGGRRIVWSLGER